MGYEEGEEAGDVYVGPARHEKKGRGLLYVSVCRVHLQIAEGLHTHCTVNTQKTNMEKILHAS